MSFSGVVCPEAIYGSAGLPQGDRSPVALAAVLACPLQAANAATSKVKNLLYLDDRTLLAADGPSLRKALEVWKEFESVSRMCTHHEGKTQFFRRMAGSSDTAEVLGATLERSRRPLTAKELRRRKQAECVAQRIWL